MREYKYILTLIKEDEPTDEELQDISLAAMNITDSAEVDVELYQGIY